MPRSTRRQAPRRPRTAKKRYQILAPLDSHFRQATCAEVQCSPHIHGWRTTLNEADPAHREAADWIRHASGRHYTEDRTPEGLTAFTFPPGQACFKAHTHHQRLDREELYVVRNPAGGVRQHAQPEHWVEDFAEHHDHLNRQLTGG